MTTYTKSDIAARVADECGLTKAVAASAVNAVIDAIGDSLVAGDKVQIAGLGILTPKKTPARQGRNPATGESITIPAGTKISFKVAADLKGRF